MEPPVFPDYQLESDLMCSSIQEPYYTIPYTYTLDFSTVKNFLGGGEPKMLKCFSETREEIEVVCLMANIYTFLFT